jgi:hypothetical protein
MNDRPVIIGGLVLFLALVTFPIWYNVAAGTSPRPPALTPPSAGGVAVVRARESSSGRGPAASCVAPRDYMRASHMTLLAGWRDDVVRRGDRRYVAYDGHRYEKSLSATCFTCHDNKVQFCDRCHDYAGVNPTCTDCHVAPRTARGR